MNKTAILILATTITACTSDEAADKYEDSIPAFPQATKLLEMMESGSITGTDLVRESVLRANNSADLNAIITLNDRAIAQAQETDQRRVSGSSRQKLLGLPIVVKDNIHVAGMPNTAGTPGLAEFMPQESNEVVSTLQSAGAIVLAKTNMHELAFGITSDNASFGAVANPYDQRKFAGGSSGGTASAIAAGIVAAGLGTDTGGSVRIPAALTGIVGFRPSNGRYTSTAVTPISHTRDTIGVMARSVVDVLLLDAVITSDTSAANSPELSQLRIGVPRAYYYDNLDSQLEIVVDSALLAMENAGVTLVEVDPQGIGPLVARIGFPVALFEVMQDLPEYLETFATGVTIADIASAATSPDVQGLFASLLRDGQIPEEVYLAALEARVELRELFATYFDANDLDAMIFPTTALPARPIDNSMQTVALNGEQVPTFPTYIRNTDPASLASLPGISLPIGVTDTGLPVGIELDGPAMSDRKLLAIAATLEPIFDFTARPAGN